MRSFFLPFDPVALGMLGKTTVRVFLVMKIAVVTPVVADARSPSASRYSALGLIWATKGQSPSVWWNSLAAKIWTAYP
jgi:hypothetical protein